MNSDSTHVSISRTSRAELADAYRIVSEYYEAAGVMARESVNEFREYYFEDRAGFWLARLDQEIVGCIALRELPNLPRSGEIKRMYVKPSHRQLGVAKLLLAALESFAMSAGYVWLYLDSASGMDTAINFYKRHGYIPCEPYNDNPQAVVFLRKSLRPST